MKDYLTWWFERHGSSRFATVDEWLDDMSNSELVLWLDIARDELESGWSPPT